MAISFVHRGKFKKTDTFFTNASEIDRKYLHLFKRYGELGIAALRATTPKDTGKTSESWYYEIIRDRGGVKLEWYNTNKEGKTPIAILIQYGHATRSGGYVEGIDFINPTLRPIFDKLSIELWREVMSI